MNHEFIQEYFDELSQISPRVKNMLDMICSNDDVFTRFTTAPASSKYHLKHEGGLFEHSINVYNIARKMIESMPMCNVSIESVAICAILHDIGKIGTQDKPYYCIGVRGGITANKGMLPHEILSVKWANILNIQLTDEEYNAILFHNGLYTPMGKTITGREEQLTLVIHWADMWASRVVEIKTEEGE